MLSRGCALTLALLLAAPAAAQAPLDDGFDAENGGTSAADYTGFTAGIGLRRAGTPLRSARAQG